jgi:hypothetical protein
MHSKGLTRWFSSALVALILLSTAAYAGVFISVNFGPPALPVYEQPICPSPGYLWTPGYWAYGPDGYFWVPGTWVMAPQPGLLWTPGYWGWGEGVYLWHPGYWGPTVGFYGGINYGYGYGGRGYEGGEWRGGDFYYNRNASNVNVTNVHNTYNTTVINNTTVNNTTVNNVSYNGGTGGTTAAATPQEQAAARDPRVVQPTAMQTQHEKAASSNRQLLASVNQGKPAIAATAKPADFSAHSVVAAKSAGMPYKAPVNTAATAHTNAAVPRPGSSPTTTQPAVPRPPSTYHATSTAMPASTPHPVNAQYEAVHPTTASVPHPATVASHPAPAPHPQFAPKAPPRPAVENHPKQHN